LDLDQDYDHDEDYLPDQGLDHAHGRCLVHLSLILSLLAFYIKSSVFTEEINRWLVSKNA
jgi:hypothetical protein